MFGTHKMNTLSVYFLWLPCRLSPSLSVSVLANFPFVALSHNIIVHNNNAYLFIAFAENVAASVRFKLNQFEPNGYKVMKQKPHFALHAYSISSLLHLCYSISARFHSGAYNKVFLFLLPQNRIDYNLLLL